MMNVKYSRFSPLRVTASSLPLFPPFPPFPPFLPISPNLLRYVKLLNQSFARS
ncbi:MAG: hypothetical protein SWY16_07250 [Cyanobacteriota bacterium]|nr:hypothetical protein [Cyanobacteriota bacterium]